jgi:hypothetical protein
VLLPRGRVVSIRDEGGYGFSDWRPHRRVQAKLDQILAILAEYDRQLPLTLRQLFYILVARLIIAKTVAEYKKLGYMLRRARRARIVPFEHIHDSGTTLPHSLVGYDNANDLGWSLRWRVRNFELDRMLGQPRRLVLWCEAAGMVAQLERVGEPYDVKVISGGGFDSLTDKWQFAQLVRKAHQPVLVLHIGDLDRSGEDIFEALSRDVEAFDSNGRVNFARLAVTEQQVSELDLQSSVEDELVVQAEAIPPDVLADIVDDALRAELDLNLMAKVEERSAAIRAEFDRKLAEASL